MLKKVFPLDDNPRPGTLISGRTENAPTHRIMDATCSLSRSTSACSLPIHWKAWWEYCLSLFTTCMTSAVLASISSRILSCPLSSFCCPLSKRSTFVTSCSRVLMMVLSCFSMTEQFYATARKIQDRQTRGLAEQAGGRLAFFRSFR